MMDRRIRREFLRLYDNDRFQEAIKFLEPFDSGDYVSYLRGLCYIASEDFERALQHLQFALDKNPDFSMARLRLAQALIELNQVDEASAHYEILSGQLSEFDDIDLHFRILLARKEASAREMALLYEEACDTENSFEVSRTVMALLAFELVSEAEKFLSRVPTRSSSKDAYYCLANYYVQIYDISSASKFFELAGRPSNSYFQLFSYSRYLRSKQDPNCLHYAERALKLSPNNDAAVASLIDALILSAEDKRALQICDDFLKENPFSSKVLERKEFLECR